MDFAANNSAMQELYAKQLAGQSMQNGMYAGTVTETVSLLAWARDRAELQRQRIVQLAGMVNQLADQLFGVTPEPANVSGHLLQASSDTRSIPVIDGLDRAQYGVDEAIDTLGRALERLGRL